MSMMLNDALDNQNKAFKSIVDKQNAAIDAMFLAGKEREERLRDALSMPPKVIYTDKIVEVPSIVTGPCEQVVVDIALYVDGVMR